MSYTVVFRPLAEDDLGELYVYIAQNSSSDRADNYLARIEATCLALADFPHRGMRRDDLFPGLRVIGFERRVSIAFVVDGTKVRILRIFYGGRDFPEDWQGVD